MIFKHFYVLLASDVPLFRISLNRFPSSFFYCPTAKLPLNSNFQYFLGKELFSILFRWPNHKGSIFSILSRSPDHKASIYLQYLIALYFSVPQQISYSQIKHCTCIYQSMDLSSTAWYHFLKSALAEHCTHN